MADAWPLQLSQGSQCANSTKQCLPDIPNNARTPANDSQQPRSVCCWTDFAFKKSNYGSFVQVLSRVSLFMPFCKITG